MMEQYYLDRSINFLVHHTLETEEHKKKQLECNQSNSKLNSATILKNIIPKKGNSVDSDKNLKMENSIALTDSYYLQMAMEAGFKTLSEKKNQDECELRDAINMERPFKELFKNLKWLNHYAITNVMAIEHALNEFQNEVFIAQPKYNLLVQNFMTVLLNTELKRNEDITLSFLDDITRDIVRFYATFFTENDRKKAKNILEKQSSIDAIALAKASIFFGASMAIIALILLEKFSHPSVDSSFLIFQLF